MEVMEEGNLMDRVPILLQRDLQFYQTHQRVLQEPICPGVVGGKLDFPRYASFAAIKIILWWEDEYFASYRKHSGLLHTERELAEGDFSKVIVKNSDPDKFVSLVTKSADLLLEHLHILSQESLDHADLSVLTATIGAAALVRNCLQIYLEAATVKICPPKGNEKGGALKLCLKQYSQMSEALAERLLDLHCRLLLLYIIQDADTLHWENTEPFFESERGSYTIQMWWLYMCGTKDDLWNSVPPKMAQRIFGGMLNETLTILTVRYTQMITSNERAQLHLVDICNLMYAIAELLPHICDSGEAYMGLQLLQQNVIIRDIHAKCRELFYCLLLRGAALGALSKVFRKGLDNMEMLTSRHDLPSAWIAFALPRLFSKEQSCQWVNDFADLATPIALSIELRVLLAFPEADWSFLIKVLLRRDAYLSTIIIKHLLKHLPTVDKFRDAINSAFVQADDKPTKCKGFLCRGECFNVSALMLNESDPVGQSNYHIVLALSYIIMATGKAMDIKNCLIKPLEELGPSNWSDCLDKRQVWNQKRPPWLEAVMHFIYPFLDCTVEILINAVEAGASVYQAMSLALTCIADMWDCLPEGIYKFTALLKEIIPVTSRPLCDSVLLHVIFAALYTELMRTAEKLEKSSGIDNNIKCDRISICYIISEAICSIDEDDKHTEQILMLLKQIKDSIILESYTLNDRRPCGFSAVSTVKIDDIDTSDLERSTTSPSANYAMELDVNINDPIAEVLASEILTTTIGKQALKICYAYLKNNKDWLLEKLNTSCGTSTSLAQIFEKGQNIKEIKDSLLKIMFYIDNTPFDQLLTGGLKIDYTMWLQTPLTLSPCRAWLHISRRYDFQSNAKVSLPEIAMVANITKAMKAPRKTE